MSAWALFVEALVSIGREFRRIAPMAVGIVWGVASVFVLVAIGRGFETTQRASLEARSAQPPNVSMLQISDPSVHHLEGMGGSTAREIAALHESYR